MIDHALKEKIALAFLEELGGWFQSDGKKLTAERVDNANDHYDANMAMDAAFRKNGKEPMTEGWVDLWNAAWARAVEIQHERDGL